MDQASSLRELMKKVNPVSVKKAKTEAVSVAFIGGEGVLNSDVLMKKIAKYAADQHTLNTAFFRPVIDQNDAVTLYAKDLRLLKETYVKLNNNDTCWEMEGSLGIIDQARHVQNQSENIKAMIKYLENERDLVLYHAGDAIGSLTINLTKIASKVVFVMKPTKKSFSELFSYLRVFAKVTDQLELGIIMDTSDVELFRKQWGYLQEMNRQEFNYTMKAIGCFDLNYIHLFDEIDVCKTFSMDFFIQKNTKKKLSESISQLF